MFDIEDVEQGSLLSQALEAAFPTLDLRAQWNPIRHASGNAPPFLLLHGRSDRFVSIAQSVRFAARLKTLGHYPLLAVVDNAGHGLVRQGRKPKPDAKTPDRLFVDFFVGLLDR